MRCYVLLLTVGLLLVSALSPMAAYYYGNGQQMPLDESSTQIAIRRDTLPPIQDWDIFLAQIAEIDHNADPLPGFLGYDVYTLNAGANVDSLLQFLNVHYYVHEALPVYTSSDGGPAFPSNQFVTKFENQVTQTERDSLIEAHALELVSVSPGGITVLRTTETSPYNALETANLFYESGLTQYAHPDLAVPGMLDFMPNDPLFQYQFYLENTEFPLIDIDAVGAWHFTLGDSSIVIAVIDDGIQVIHEDLDSTKFFAGWDFVGPWYFDKWDPILPDDDPNPHPRSIQAHGMCVAGIISADIDNGLGMAGIAPGCSLMRLKISDDWGNLPHPYPGYDTSWYGLPSICAQAIEYAYMNGADVINGSWGWPAPDWYWDVIADELAQAVDSGVVNVFSAGNDASEIKFPAWLNTTIAVGAIQPNGYRWEYSNRGSALDVVAPSGDLEVDQEPGVYTLDIVGDSGGYNDYLVDCPSTNYDYMCEFGGTSAAAPQVAAIVGLIRSRIPDYWREMLDGSGFYQGWVQNVIRQSAVDQVGDPTYDLPGQDISYGWGVANASRALLAITRGDVDNSGGIDISDLVYMVDYMMTGGPEPLPDVRVGDCDCSGMPVDISDLVLLIDYQFSGGPPPETPCYEY